MISYDILTRETAKQTAEQIIQDLSAPTLPDHADVLIDHLTEIAYTYPTLELAPPPTPESKLRSKAQHIFDQLTDFATWLIQGTLSFLIFAILATLAYHLSDGEPLLGLLALGGLLALAGRFLNKKRKRS